MSDSQSVSTLCLQGGSLDIGKGFWRQWQQYRDYLYRCCIKWMGGNRTDAEDALSRAMLKAWEKVQKYAGEIDNFKSWLSTLTHNLCVDIQREHSRGAKRVEDIEVYASGEEQGLVRSEETPEIAMETGEKRIVIRGAIDNLPSRLRETFILHFYRELSYQEIAQQQEISYQNVCKRISQARKILREELRGYFIGEDGTDTELSVTPTPAATESAIGEMSKRNAGGVPIVGETVTVSDSAIGVLPQATEVEEVEIVVGGEPQEAALSVQHRESAMGRAVADGLLEVKRDCCRWEIEVALCGMQSAPTLALAQEDEEAGEELGNPVWWALSALERFLGFIVAPRGEPWRKVSLFSLVRSHLSDDWVRSRDRGICHGALRLTLTKRYLVDWVTDILHQLYHPPGVQNPWVVAKVLLHRTKSLLGLNFSPF